MLVCKYLLEKNDLNLDDPEVCWETDFGQEMYRLTWSFFLVLVIVPFLLQTFHSAVFGCLRLSAFLMAELNKSGSNYQEDKSKKKQRKRKRIKIPFLFAPEFDIAAKTMHLLHAQAVAWMGLYFCPLIPSLLCLIYFVTFYLEKVCRKKSEQMYVRSTISTIILQLNLKMNCRYSTKAWRASQTQTVLYILCLILFLGGVIVYTLAVTRWEPSQHCGPFQGYSIPALVTEYLPRLNELFVFNPGFAAAVDLVLM